MNVHEEEKLEKLWKSCEVLKILACWLESCFKVCLSGKVQSWKFSQNSEIVSRNFNEIPEMQSWELKKKFIFTPMHI